MSVNVTCPTYFTYKRLSFGVPLEDVFPPGEIHPNLKNLFTQVYENVVTKGYPVAEVLRHCQGSLQQRLELKEKVILSTKCTGIKAPPGTFLWVIRHFIGLLPIQLMPRYIGDQKYFWCKITEECRKCLSKYATKGKNDQTLSEKLAGELLRLPPHNFLLFATLLNSLRMLAVLPGGEPRINKTASLALTKYFSSSVFIRPFRPGSNTKVDTQYYPLMLYSILKWPEIRRILIERSNYSFEVPLEEIYPGYSANSQPPGHPHYLWKRHRDDATQTTLPDCKDLKQKEDLVMIVPPSYHDSDYVKDVGSQTETNFSTIEKTESKYGISRKTCCCCCLGSHYEKLSWKKPLSELNKRNVAPCKIDNEIIFTRKECCCSYSTNYETEIRPVEGSKSTPITVTKPYGWTIDAINCESKASRFLDCNQELNNSVFVTAHSTTSENIDFDYDGYDNYYSTSNLISDEEGVDNSTNIIDTSDTVKKEEKQVHNEALKEKNIEMGWSFLFSSKKLSSEKLIDDKVSTDSDRYPSPPVGWNMSDGGYYKGDYKLHQSLNKELKERLGRLKLKSKCDKTGISSSEDEGKDKDKKNSKIKSQKSTESRKSLMRVNKIISRLDVLRIFKSKKTKPKKSYSYEQINSRVKYKKMGSASSIL